MQDHTWVREFAGAITVCDPTGIILEMNDKSAKALEDKGGRELIGKNLLDCHPEAARAQVEELMESRRANVYTIEKNGVKKLIYQTPWYKDGQYAGFVQLALEIPFEMPHLVRQ